MNPQMSNQENRRSGFQITQAEILEEGTQAATEDWQAIAERASKEQDPNKLLQLIQDLCDKLDSRDHARKPQLNPYLAYRHAAGLSDFLKAAVEATEANFGSCQLFDSSTGALRLVAHHGFGTEFSGYFETVRPHSCSCGTAMTQQHRIICADVSTDPMFGEEDKAVLIRANVLSVQSTPLVSSAGKLIGVVSTHCDRTRDLELAKLQCMDALAASFIEKFEP
jgi:GAF domain-containing protein